jgi:hypothetical protein
MKAPLPPNFTPPFWATRNFRLIILFGLLGLAVMGVMVFQIGPALNQKPVRQKQVDPSAFVPKPATAGESRGVKYEGVLENVKDGSSIDDQEQPYQYLVRTLSRMDAAQLTKDAKNVDYAYLCEDAGRDAREVKILPLASSPTRSGWTAPAGVQFIHRTYLSTTCQGAEGYVVDLPSRRAS